MRIGIRSGSKKNHAQVKVEADKMFAKQVIKHAAVTAKPVVHECTNLLACRQLSNFHSLASHRSVAKPSTQRLTNMLTSRKLSNFHPLASHRDTEDNKIETYFDFTLDNYKRVMNFNSYQDLITTYKLYVLYCIYYTL